MRFTCRKVLLPWIVLTALAGCATKQRAVTLPAPTRQTSPLTGKYETGTILAVRPVAPANNSATSTILTTLNQPQVAAVSGQAVELIIQRQDGSVASIVQQPQPGLEFVPGQKIDIVEAAATVVKPQ